MPKYLVIIPAYNESKNLCQVVEKITKLKPKKYKLDYVIINDGSTDNTKELCQENKFNVINLPVNLGIGGAVQTGYKYAYYKNYDGAIQFDGDNQHDENYLDALIKELELGNDLVIGSRFVAELSTFKSNYIRRFGSKFLSGLIKLLTKVKVYDVTSGFRACNRELLKYLAFNYPIDYPEPDSLFQTIKLGYKVKEIPVEMHEREHGKSSLNLIKGGYYMIKVTLAILISAMFWRKKVK